MLRYLLVVAASASALVATGCSRSCGAPADRPESVAAASIAQGGSLVASTRTDPATYNRFLPSGANAATDLVTYLTHARVARVNRSTDELEPWLAEGWTQSDDGRVYTVRLRPGIVFSDGVPFTSADVLFSFRVAYDPGVASALRSAMQVNGKPLDVSAPDPQTVVIRFPEPFAPGLRLLDHLPVLPKHKLEAALDAGKLAEEWTPSKPLADVVGLGPFVLAEHVSGQRLVFERNPHYFRRDASGTQLPYLDRITLAVVPDQTAESLRLEAGEIDLMANGEIRPQDHATFKRLADQGRLHLLSAGTGLDPDFLAFNLRPVKQPDPRLDWLRRREFRQAVSFAVDRQAIINTVYLGAAIPIYGPVSPGNRTWHSAAAPTYPHDPGKARQLLASAGLTDRNGDGTLEDTHGAPARFSIITQAGHLRERVASVLQAQLATVGLAVDVVGLDPGGIFQRWSAGDYDAIYFGLQVSSTDPALTPDFWVSSGLYHFWHPRQTTPATEWEGRIDTLMHQQATATDLEVRKRAFAEVQRILGEELPMIYFVAPEVTLATTTKVGNPSPAPQIPQLLWSPDTLAVAGPGGTR